MDELIETWTSCHTPHEVFHKLQSAGVIAGAVQSPKIKVDEDPQLKHRNFLPEIEHAELGKAKFEAEPMRLSRSPWELRRASPLMGKSTLYSNTATMCIARYSAWIRRRSRS